MRCSVSILWWATSHRPSQDASGAGSSILWQLDLFEEQLKKNMCWCCYYCYYHQCYCYYYCYYYYYCSPLYNIQWSQHSPRMWKDWDQLSGLTLGIEAPILCWGWWIFMYIWDFAVKASLPNGFTLSYHNCQIWGFSPDEQQGMLWDSGTQILQAGTPARAHTYVFFTQKQDAPSLAQECVLPWCRGWTWERFWLGLRNWM